MYKEIAEAWATALESGDYVQSFKTLSDGYTVDGVPRMCAKGVLYDVHRKLCHAHDVDELDFSPSSFHLAQWANTQSISLLIDAGEDGPNTVTFLNDIEKMEFKVLADIIREKSEEI
jgi:hypothetical protein